MWEWIRAGDAGTCPLNMGADGSGISQKRAYVWVDVLLCSEGLEGLKGMAFQQQSAGVALASWVLILFSHERKLTDAVDWIENGKDESGVYCRLPLKDPPGDWEYFEGKKFSLCPSVRNQHVVCQWLTATE